MGEGWSCPFRDVNSKPRAHVSTRVLRTRLSAPCPRPPGSSCDQVRGGARRVGTWTVASAVPDWTDARGRDKEGNFVPEQAGAVEVHPPSPPCSI